MADTPRLILPARDGRSLAIEFERREDRYTHGLYLSDEQGERPLAVSLEGSDREAWPPSPALQQLSIQRLADGREAALLVGMAGKSHFSLSITGDADGLSFTFDVACHYKLTPEFLGSSYRLELSAELEFRSQEQFPADLRFDDRMAVVRALTENAPVPPAALRWCYAIGLPGRK